ncbi:MAG: DUF1501 domain-containing protein [Planctomycetota bacterium]|nr:DUF1501 domain-containing protein [Planctomycetota bacterium]
MSIKGSGFGVQGLGWSGCPQHAPSGASQQADSRRGFLQRVAGGIYGTALASLLAGDGTGTQQAWAATVPRRPPIVRKAKSVIHLFMNGGPSQMDLFDPKPALDKRHGESLIDQIAGEVEFIGQAGDIMRSPFRFAQHGESGQWVSEVMPYLATQVDKLTFIRSMQTVNITHEPAIYKIQSGQMLPGYPAMGAWITYGLGSENDNLPGYIVLDDPLALPVNGVENWQAGFLPQQYQGTRLRSTGSPVINLKPEYDEPAAIIQAERELIAGLNQLHLDARPQQRGLAARIASYELAARMQLSATDALDLSQESAETFALYGIGKEPTDSYGRRCLMARRLVERGVRFIQIFINGQIWDNHANIPTELRAACEKTDQPVAGLLQDLQQRGLLDQTLVLWCGEFGRLPISQGSAGRDHNKNAFTLWMAGAGLKQGYTHGTTDELGLRAVENCVSVPDWHATILHLLGLDFDQLSYDVHGLKEKLTGVFDARVVKEILA